MKKVPIFSAGKAFNSLRNSGFDFPTAIGEIVDNSIQAEAKTIYIEMPLEKSDKKKSHRIDHVVVADDGVGMEPEVLHSCLRLGFSTRYDNRGGIGRFGVGATLAAISQCKKIKVFSKTKKNKWHSISIDLDDVENSEEVFITEPILENPSKDYDFKHGTIVEWSKCDRLNQDANGNTVKAEEHFEDLKIWIERAYRKFMNQGVSIFIDSHKLFPYDPLYLNPKLTRFPKDPIAKVVFEHTIYWPIPNSPEKKSAIHIVVTRLNDEMLQERQDGGSEYARDRRIDTNEGVSILRKNREVAYGNMYPMTPREEAKDRYWGMEIHFDPELDECWDVKNVKRGARPTPALRDLIKKDISSIIMEQKKIISSIWDKKTAEKSEKEGDTHVTEQLVAETENRQKPKAETKPNATPSETQKEIKEILESPLIPEKEKPQLKKKLEESNLPITVSTTAMSGSDFFTTRHIGNGKVHIEFNYSHQFFAIYNRLKNLEKNSPPEISVIARDARQAIELLIMAYGRAESMLDMTNPDIESVVVTLRTYWGSQLQQYIKTLEKHAR